MSGSFSYRPHRRGAPRPNYFVNVIVDDIAHVAAKIAGTKNELSGREALSESDLIELESRIVGYHAALDRFSISLNETRPALLTIGADSTFMWQHVEALALTATTVSSAPDAAPLAPEAQS